MSKVLWYVVHTKPRCEKKLAAWCARGGTSVTLPCYESVHKYRRKTVVFRKPLFPGYVFLELEPGGKEIIQRHDHVANVLDVFDQETFARQLEGILRALDSRLDVRLAPSVGEGMLVRIKSGPLQGLEGWVERRFGMSTVLLRLDFINQAAAVRIEADQLELI
ncbi:MAG TPA: transcription termination/antitermination NusG family protein [Verrucomicrobiae bacterium]